MNANGLRKHGPEIIEEHKAGAAWPKLAGVAVLVLAVVAGVVAPGAWLERLQLIGFAISPQRPEHTLFIGGTALPLEARMLGIQLAFFSTLVVLVLLGRAKRGSLPAGPKLAVLLGFVVLMGIDGLNATLFDNGLPYVYVPDNWLRLATGLLNGIAVGVIALAALNALLWSESDRRPVVERWHDLAGLMVGVAGLFGAMAWSVLALPHATVATAGSGLAWAPLYVVSTLGILGELAMLSVINALFCLAVVNRLNVVRAWRGWPLVGGVVVLDVVELGVLIVGHAAWAG